DGRADVCKSFYDHLHCPTGFEFWEGGVLVVDQPRLVWLKDTDGDDRADLVVQLLDGWASDDTHHTIGAFESSPGGILHMLEGIAMSTAVETPWGPMRNFGSSGAYRLDPRALRITHFNTPGYGNPWCYVFNAWGQGFCGDGTGGNQHWDSPLSGAQFRGRRGLNSVFDNEGMRPVVGTEFLYTRQFPADVQGQFIYACVINMNGLTRFTVKDDGAGFSGARLKKSVDGQLVPDDFLVSSDKHFRPVDPQIGPDGALWFGDWANPLIGHMQYSQRDPNRDRTHGRIYRMVYRDKPLLEPVTQQGQGVAELLEQLREPEPRTRARARSELHARPTPEVMAGINTWLKQLAASATSDGAAEADRLLTEALWLEQSFHTIDETLLERVLHAETADARAAAVRVVADQLEFYGLSFRHSPQAEKLTQSRLPQLAQAVQDENPRVRLEAVRGLSFVPTLAAIDTAFGATRKPMDYWLKYTLAQMVGALEGVWKSALESGEIAKRDSAEAKYLSDYGLASAPGVRVQGLIDTLLSKRAKERDKRAALTAFTEMKGNLESGSAVFRRTCINCHRVSGQGFEY
ncbi:MAG TPA: cytochrome C, partial [Pirellulales bacterium]|nr:cytochrome C [Pirellulales bacterium]